MPTGATQAIQLREVGITAPQAIFVTPDEIVLADPFVQIASDPFETLTSPRVAALRDVFLVGASTATRFVDLLHELATAVSGAPGVVPPRIGNRAGHICWLIGGQTVKTVQAEPGGPEWAGVVARHQAAYRTIRNLGVPQLHSKYLATLIAKYRISEARAVTDFIPGDLPRESPVTPSTTLTESFPGTSATLGGDQTWTEVTGTWGNDTGKAACTGDGATRTARCEGVLSTDDMSVAIQVESTSAVGAYRGPVARFAAAAETGYSAISRPEINDYYGQYLNAGTYTDIITSELTGAITLPDTSKIAVNGDQVEIFQGPNSRGSTTHTLIAGNVRGGMGAYAESLTVGFDDFLAEDLGGTQSYSYTASGGIAFSGAGSIARVRTAAGSGGISLAGSASSAFHESTRTAVASGGLTFGGAAGYQAHIEGAARGWPLHRRRRRS